MIVFFLIVGYAAPENIDSWLNCVGTGKMNEKENEVIEVVGHDIYAIGTQVRSARCYDCYTA